MKTRGRGYQMIEARKNLDIPDDAELGASSKHIIRNIVGRHHVSTPHYEIAKAVDRKISGIPKDHPLRKKAIDYAKKVHQDKH